MTIIGFFMTGCDSPTDSREDGPAEPVAPASIAVTPVTAYVGQGEQLRFTATVGPLGAPQDVTWSVTPAGAGSITAGGLLTITGADVGNTLTVTATVVNHPALFSTATVTVPKPISITVTGIPSQYSGQWGGIQLRNLETGNWVARGDLSISGSAATSSLWDWNRNNQFATPGDYEVSLTIGSGDSARIYRIAEMNITTGANTIPFSTFTFIPPMTITVTGIPQQYHGMDITLRDPETRAGIARGWAWIYGSAGTFTLLDWDWNNQFATPGDFEVRLIYGEGGVYRIAEMNIIAGSNTIPFSAFTLIPPITVTVTDIPTGYQGGNRFAEIIFRVPGGTTDYIDWGWAEITGSSVTITFGGTIPGIYDVDLFFFHGDWRDSVYTASARNITASSNIPFSQFAALPPSITITITGIPSQYQNGFGTVELSGADYEFDQSRTAITSSSAVFRFWFADPGTYEIRLIVEGSARWMEGFASARPIAADTTIPWSAFNFVDGGEVMSVTITGIPTRYHGEWANVLLRVPGAWIWVIVDSAWISGPSVTFGLGIAVPGVHDVMLWLNDGEVVYFLPPRNIYAGVSIPFDDFTLATSGAFLENLERSKQRPPGRSRIHPLRAHQ